MAAGKGKGAIFKNGEVVRTVDEDDYMDELMREIEKIKRDYKEADEWEH